jgi:hypothetical protein
MQTRSKRKCSSSIMTVVDERYIARPVSNNVRRIIKAPEMNPFDKPPMKNEEAVSFLLNCGFIKYTMECPGCERTIKITSVSPKIFKDEWAYQC